MSLIRFYKSFTRKPPVALPSLLRVGISLIAGFGITACTKSDQAAPTEHTCTVQQPIPVEVSLLSKDLNVQATVDPASLPIQIHPPQSPAPSVNVQAASSYAQMSFVGVSAPVPHDWRATTLDRNAACNEAFSDICSGGSRMCTEIEIANSLSWPPDLGAEGFAWIRHANEPRKNGHVSWQTYSTSGLTRNIGYAHPPGFAEGADPVGAACCCVVFVSASVE